MTNQPIAVDIVLIPSPDIISFAIEMNRKIIAETAVSPIILGKTKTIPHISVCMCTLAKNTDILIENLRDIADKYLPLPITISGIQTVTTASGDLITGLEIHRSDDLFALHTEVMQAAAPFFGRTITPDMLALGTDEELAPFTIPYITHFASHSSYDQYHPHITLGYEQSIREHDMSRYPVTCTGTTLAVCHLGNHCTCHSVVYSFKNERPLVT